MNRESHHNCYGTILLIPQLSLTVRRQGPSWSMVIFNWLTTSFELGEPFVKFILSRATPRWVSVKFSPVSRKISRCMLLPQNRPLQYQSQITMIGKLNEMSTFRKHLVTRETMTHAVSQSHVTGRVIQNVQLFSEETSYKENETPTGLFVFVQFIITTPCNWTNN